MKFKLNGINWQIRLALKRADSVKNEIIVDDIGGIHEYLAKSNKMDREKVKEIINGSD